MKLRYSVSIIILLAILPMPVRADEGMWMVNAISKSLARQMETRGLRMDSGEIYNEDAVSLSDAIVSLDFACTGSIISDQGLLITNHHCAYGDVHALSTNEHNYLEDGFWAKTPEEELHIPGKSVQFLERILDVTDEVNATIEEEKAAGKGYGMRRISYLIEKKYSAETGLEASLSSMWAGERYYLALYRTYKDIRLVAAPPVSIAAFGGDIDNWEWPQQKCDFALYRIYADENGNPAEYSGHNVPLSPKHRLHISTQGYAPGDYAMILGYPGSTDRYASSAKIAFEQNVSLPVSNKVRADQMAIINRWMNEDPEIRLKYSDRYFSLSNVQELNEGEVLCYGRYGVARHKRREEKKLLGAYQGLLSELDCKYDAISDARRNTIYYRETLVRGTQLATIASRIKNNRAADPVKEYAAIDLRVEKDLFRYSMETYFENVDSSYWGPFQKHLKDSLGTDYDAIMDYLWTDGIITLDCNLCRFFNDVSIRDFNSVSDKLEGETTVSTLGKEYTHAMYRSRHSHGLTQYPDANSTMRLTYGRVRSFRRDGRAMPWQTFSDEILAKEDSTSYEFHLIPEWKRMLASQTDPLPVNFITDNDITGGNSGSPVLNADGELIGLAFDGNKESLASDKAFTDKYNRCVCVDIRFVLWTLKEYAGMSRVIDEINR